MLCDRLFLQTLVLVVADFRWICSSVASSITVGMTFAVPTAYGGAFLMHFGLSGNRLN